MLRGGGCGGARGSGGSAAMEAKLTLEYDDKVSCVMLSYGTAPAPTTAGKKMAPFGSLGPVSFTTDAAAARVSCASAVSASAASARPSF